MKVLVAEDNPVNQEVAIGFLESLGCDVTMVSHGAEVVHAYQEASGRFDVILMDCQMPVMDGFEATRKIRTLEGEDQHIPIFALTANAFEGCKAGCLDAGMDAVLTKPLRRQELDALLSQWRPTQPTGGTADMKDEPASSTSLLDTRQLKSLRSLDPDGTKGFLRRAIVKFADYGDRLVDEMTDNAAQGDLAEVSRLAHSLKSSSANLGAVDLSARCQELESVTKDVKEPIDIERQVEALSRAYGAVKHELLALAEV